ncbi:MAG: hypothetical protein LBM25_04825 [Bacteroidales bacterium]|nr:hypothetical protein [Bacteroidales bacterium]
MGTRKIKKRRKKIYIAIIVIISSIAIIASLRLAIRYLDYRSSDNNFNIVIPNEENYVLGIDVSSHQKDISWKDVKNSGVEFCFIKATEGIDFIDKKYKENYIQSKEEGIFVSAYHFFRFGKSGKEQAINFINTVAIEHLDMPPVVDVEKSGNYFSFSSVSQIQKDLREFIEEIEENYSVKPIIYTNEDGYKKYIKGSFDNYPLWLSRLYDKPSNNLWTFWQYSHSGSIKGIDHKVDLNLFYSDRDTFLKYIDDFRKQKR